MIRSTIRTNMTHLVQCLIFSLLVILVVNYSFIFMGYEFGPSNALITPMTTMICISLLIGYLMLTPFVFGLLVVSRAPHVRGKMAILELRGFYPFDFSSHQSPLYRSLSPSLSLSSYDFICCSSPFRHLMLAALPHRLVFFFFRHLLLDRLLLFFFPFSLNWASSKEQHWKNGREIQAKEQAFFMISEAKTTNPILNSTDLYFGQHKLDSVNLFLMNVWWGS